MAKKTDDVDGFLETLTHPRKSEILKVRAALLQAKPGITEQVKWNAPSLCIGGDDRITFRLQPGDVVELVFHRGAKKRTADDDFTFDDPSGLLQWRAPDRATITFTDMADVDEKLPTVVDLASRWMTATHP